MTATAASGLRARMESLELLANNVANTSTGGYKADREFYNLYTGLPAQDEEPPSTMPVIERSWIDLSQGLVRATGNPLDVALSGSGFFSVQGPAGQLYTRNGSFHLGAAGKLITSEGYAVQAKGGANLTIPGSSPIEISSDGTVTQDGNTIGQLEVVDFTSTAGLAKQGGSYFRAADPSLRAAAPAATSVQQGKLEESNTGAAESAVRLISVMRQFEMMQKAVLIGSDMSKQAIEEVAKVGS
jgi:flagellar basal-body rod protein FlgF